MPIPILTQKIRGTVPPVVKDKVHYHASHVYGYGEHGCAVAYALHEFAGLHILVLGLSGVLLSGFILLAVDYILESN